MNHRTYAALAFGLAATPALALDCAKALTATEHAICNSPSLRQADRDLTRLYGQVRGAIAARARPALLRQQKDWLNKRDSRCGRVTACLVAAYQRRIGALTSLNANAQAYDGRLTDITPVTLTGEWHVDGVVDTAGRPLPADLARQLATASLPSNGTTVRAGPGKLCLSSQTCVAVGWTATTLGDAESPRVAQDLRLPPSTRAYTGTDGSKWAYHFTLVPQNDGRLLALFGLCDGGGTRACRNGYQVWRPAKTESRFIEGTL